MKRLDKYSKVSEVVLQRMLMPYGDYPIYCGPQDKVVKRFMKLVRAAALCDSWLLGCV